jgi:hypothetical protein
VQINTIGSKKCTEPYIFINNFRPMYLKLRWNEKIPRKVYPRRNRKAVTIEKYQAKCFVNEFYQSLKEKLISKFQKQLKKPPQNQKRNSQSHFMKL